MFAASRSAMLDYFEGIGHKCDTRNNPTDHVLDVIMEDQLHRISQHKDEHVDLIHHYRNSELFRCESQRIQVRSINVKSYFSRPENCKKTPFRGDSLKDSNP